MKYKKLKKVILFGGARQLADFAQYLKTTNLEVVVFSSKRHLEESVSGKRTLREILENNKIRYYNSGDINRDRSIVKEVTEDTLGIAFGAAWMFEKKVVSLFSPAHLLDIIGVNLPQYDGGAHYSWKILHQSQINGTNLQVILGGEENFHRGEIVASQRYRLSPALKIPEDFFSFIVGREIKFLKKFIEGILKGKEFKLKALKMGEYSYYPFLSTKINGFINWSWSGPDIYLFINSFDRPYPGASTFVNGQKLILKNCRLIKPQEKYHPFSSGLVIRKDKGGVYVSAIGGLLYIQSIIDESGRSMTGKIKLGDRLYTPYSILDGAMGFKAVYDAKGLKIESQKNI